MLAGPKTKHSSVLLISAAAALFSLSALAAQHTDQSGTQPANTSDARHVQSYGKVPLSFEANRGQLDSRVKYMSKGSGYGIYLTGDEAVLALTKRDCAGQQLHTAQRPVVVRDHEGCEQEKTVVTMRLAGNAPANPVGEELLPGTANYFVGSDPAAWRSGVPTYAKVRYGNVYPGVDLVYYGNQRQLEYDFAVAPNADAKTIRMQFTGVNKMKIDGDGDLILSATNGDIAFRKPVVYQDQNGRRELVAGRFKLGKRHTVGFVLNDYDRSKPVIIDPVLAYSTYLGGSGKAGDVGLGIAVDSSGDAYVTGQTDSSDFPLTAGSYQQSNESTSTTAYSAFVTKMNATGTALVYSTYLGGSGNTEAVGIAVDGTGNAYVTGHTFSSNFPTTSGAFQTTSSASSSDYVAFVTKLNATGTALVYSTVLGGSGNGGGTGETTSGIVVDGLGNAYVTGYTYSSNFPVTTGAFQTTNAANASGIQGGFVSKLNATGSALVYSTFLSGSGHNGIGDNPAAIAIDSYGDAYVTGATGSSNFPVTTGAYLTTNPAGTNQTTAFVSELNAAGTALVYSTYLGGSKSASGNAIVVSGSGDAYIAGDALYTDFPVTTGAYQTSNNAAAESTTNAFVTELNASGTGLVYSTWLGGSGAAINAEIHSGDVAGGIALDESGDAYVTGTAYSSNFPTSSGAVQTTNAAAANKTSNAFVTELNAAGTALVYSSFLGGSGWSFGTAGYYHGDNANGLALDGSYNVYVTGTAYSIDFPLTSGAYQANNLAGNTSGSNLFITKVTISTATETTTTLNASANPASIGTSVTFTATVAAVSGSTKPTGSVVFTVDGTVASTVTLSSGTATYASSSLAGGTHMITASYTGSANFAASTSGNLTETINEPTVVAPAFSPAVGTYTAAQSVTLSSTTPGATIYYTLNGTTPTTASTQYSNAIAVSATTTIEAIAVATNYNNSIVATGTYTITPPATVATPQFSVPAGPYTTIQSVVLSDTTAGATIYYTVNGTTPTTASTKYTTAISVGTTETIEAMAVATGDTNSAVASASYTITLPAAPAPQFSLTAGSYASRQTVTLSDSASGATFYYTTNGATPTTSSTRYTKAIPVNGTETIKAVAIATGYGISPVASAKYTIKSALPPGGTVGN